MHTHMLSLFLGAKIYFGHLMRSTDSFEKTQMLGKIKGGRSRGRQRMRCLDGITDSVDMRFEWTPGVSDGQGGLACCDSWGCKKSDMTEQLHFHFSLSCIAEGNGNSLQYSCLENSMGRGAWQATVQGVAKSRT